MRKRKVFQDLLFSGLVSIEELNRLEHHIMQTFNWNLCPYLAPNQLQKYIKLLLIDGLDSIPDFKKVFSDKKLEIRTATVEFRDSFYKFCRLYPEEKSVLGQTDYDPKRDPKLQNSQLVQAMKVENLQKRNEPPEDNDAWSPDKSFTP